jgi:hypothetical protein
MDYETHITALSQFRLTLTHPVSRDGFEVQLEPPLVVKPGKPVIRLKFRRVVSKWSAMESDTASACDRALPG